MYSTDRNNYRLNELIQRYIESYDGTVTGQDIQNMYENSSSYESICDRIGICYEDYEEE